MKKTAVLFLGLFLIRCAAYKQLKPEPELTPQELGYIEIKDDKDDFELDKDKKYFMVFPPPQHEKSYLVLENTDKNLLSTYLTAKFDDGKGSIVKIDNETPDPLILDVYPLDDSVQKFYWVVERVEQDMKLRMKYRYVEMWRFKFENKYDSFRQTFGSNKVDRSPYRDIGSAPDLMETEIDEYLDKIELTYAKLQGMQNSLREIEQIFPVNIVNTTDSSYQNYLLLKNDLQDELKFQEDFRTVLTLFKNDIFTRGSSGSFFESLPAFEDFFKTRSRFPENVVAKIRDILGRRLPEAVPFYKQKLAARNNGKRIDSRVEQINELYASAGIAPPADFSALYRFVQTFNGAEKALTEAQAKYKALKSSVESSKNMPGNTYFGGILTKLSRLKFGLPKIKGKVDSPYGAYKCVTLLDKRIKKLRFKINTLLNQYREADALVPQINVYKKQKNYRAMLGLLKKNAKLKFLRNMYQGIDALSLKRQKKQVLAALEQKDWAGAEATLKTFFLDRNFLDYKKVKKQKLQTVRTLEDTLVNRVERVSKKRARRFVNENIKTLKNVDVLYENVVFRPVHVLTFSSRSPQALQQRNQRLISGLQKLKNEEFPARAIQLLYNELSADPNNNGVLKARAVVAHGTHYKGKDKKIKRSVAECDPWASKWITKAKSYRRLFALPVTTKPRGKNEYVFRVNLRIPSEAKFPVYEVYIRLPKEVAENASTAQWYDKITLNKKVVKNEGRFSITSPLASNGYECQITPLRAVKDGDSVLEVHFTHPSFKVQQVSIMAQKPIIKKH